MFENGTRWLRADFHLHTRADKEFIYREEDNEFVNKYVDKLSEENIELGAITNHNKFDFDEFKAIKNKARRKGIIILPGVELSVKEGANGIHCLIIFKDKDWIRNGKEKINDFLNEVFKGIENRENENTRCNEDLLGTIKILDSYNSNYFIIMAHVEQNSGFFKECDGGLIISLSENNLFKERVLGFQKGRTNDVMMKVKDWMGYELPYVEGSDCKSINQIGKGEKVYIKVGDGSFDSVLLSFKDFENRISLKEKIYNHSHIKSIEFVGGKMANEKIIMSPELNNLIGIRGSGKSSILEAIRYALNIEPSKVDEKYKTDVVHNFLESGGKIIIEVQDVHKKTYKISRILGELPHIYDSEGQEIDVKIDSIIESPLYFGQKDLSNMNEGYELDLLNKLVGRDKDELKSEIGKVENKIAEKIKELFELEDKVNNLPEIHTRLEDTKHKIKIFEEQGVGRKLSRQVDFQKDEAEIKRLLLNINVIKNKMKELINLSHFDEIIERKKIDSKQIPELFQKIRGEILNIIEMKSEVSDLLKKLEATSENVNDLLEETQIIIRSLEEEFAEIKRQIDIPNIDPDAFSKLKMDEIEIKRSIEQISEQSLKRSMITAEIKSLSDKRNELLRQEFNNYQSKISDINSTQTSLELEIQFKGNKEVFQNKLQEVFKGSRITRETYSSISSHITDFTSLLIDGLLNDSEKMKGLLTESQLMFVKKILKQRYYELVSVETPNKIEIKYRGKLIEKHSIGQRASALVLFILSQRDNHLIMIDQPEDDLDNQVIYNEIIKKIRMRKDNVQFIFATHNANIPVLGDSEQVIAISFDEKKMGFESGSIDNSNIQNKIVDIMEGGQEAFNKRTLIYNMWSKE